MPGPMEYSAGVPDGMKLDAAGNLWCTGPGGVWVVSPAGEHLGTHQERGGRRQHRLGRRRLPDAVPVHVGHRPHRPHDRGRQPPRLLPVGAADAHRDRSAAHRGRRHRHAERRRPPGRRLGRPVRRRGALRRAGRDRPHRPDHRGGAQGGLACSSSTTLPSVGAADDADSAQNAGLWRDTRETGGLSSEWGRAPIDGAVPQNGDTVLHKQRGNAFTDHQPRRQAARPRGRQGHPARRLDEHGRRVVRPGRRRHRLRDGDRLRRHRHHQRRVGSTPRSPTASPCSPTSRPQPRCSRRLEPDRMTYIVAVRWTAKEGEADEIARALGELEAPTLAEPGVIEWRPHRDPESPAPSSSSRSTPTPMPTRRTPRRRTSRSGASASPFQRLAERRREFYEPLGSVSRAARASPTTSSGTHRLARQAGEQVAPPRRPSRSRRGEGRACIEPRPVEARRPSAPPSPRA